MAQTHYRRYGSYNPGTTVLCGARSAVVGHPVTCAACRRIGEAAGLPIDEPPIFPISGVTLTPHAATEGSPT